MSSVGRNRIAATFLGVALALSLGVRTASVAQPAPAQPTPADVRAAQITPPPTGAARADQISQSPGAPARPSQISPSVSSGPTSADQLTTTMAVAEAPPPLSTPAQGRDARAPAIHGHDRCDPAAGPIASQPACANILDHRADQFSAPESQTARTADPDAPASGLVNDIVNGGTGTVVIAPNDGK